MALTKYKIFDSYLKTWRELGFHQRFEQIVAMLLNFLVSIIALFACIPVFLGIFDLVTFETDMSSPQTFRNLFAGVLTVLIALEFNHSIVQVVERKQSIIQVRIVVQIAILALVRKFILIDASKTEAMVLIGLGVIVFSLAALYWAVQFVEKGQPEVAPLKE